MLLCLLLALVLLTRRRWLAAGIVTGLATLSWQPVLVVPVAAALVVAALTPSDRRTRVVGIARFAAGGALTLVVTVGYFLLAGAFDAFVEGFWSVNAAYTDQESLVARPGWAWEAVSSWLGWTTGLLVAGCVLSVALALVELRRIRPPDAAVVSLGAATLAGVAWSTTAFNGAPDAMLVLPLAATGIGGGAALAVGWLPDSWPRSLVVVTAGWVVLALATTLHLTWTDRSTELATERAAAAAVFAAAPADASVFAFDAPQPLAIVGRESISRFVLFGEGMKEYAASQWAGGFPDYVDQIRGLRPTVVVTTSRGLGGSLRPLARDYVEIEGGTDWRAFLHEDAVPLPAAP